MEWFNNGEFFHINQVKIWIYIRLVIQKKIYLFPSYYIFAMCIFVKRKAVCKTELNRVTVARDNDNKDEVNWTKSKMSVKNSAIFPLPELKFKSWFRKTECAKILIALGTHLNMFNKINIFRYDCFMSKDIFKKNVIIDDIELFFRNLIFKKQTMFNINDLKV